MEDKTLYKNIDLSKNIYNKPFVTFRVTEDCNFRCKYCVLEFPKNYMSTDVVKKSIDEIKVIFGKSGITEFDFVCSGGEPLLNVDAIIDILEYTKDQNSIVTILTNGYSISGLKRLEKYKDRIIISMSCDGKQESQLANRSAIITEEFIQLAKTFKGFSFTFTIAPNNAKYIKETYDYLSSYDPAWIGNTVVYNAFWTDQERQDLKNGLEYIFKTETKNKPYTSYIYQYDNIDGKIKSKFNCTNAKEFTVMYDGTFTKCFTELLIGNTINKENATLSTIRTHKIHKEIECDNCDHKGICIECVVAHKNKLTTMYEDSRLNQEQKAIVEKMLESKGFDPSIHILCFYMECLDNILSKYWDELVINYFTYYSNRTILKKLSFYKG